MSRLIFDKFAAWQVKCEARFLQLKKNEEDLDLVQDIEKEIQHAQYRAALSVNKELIGLYYNIG